ncbi:K(+)-transporting ATPase subunit C [Oscillatoria acuminata]|uniref:Potassium-transporting ATPase KdpC subunit n=1 Tax=Oscillatoria acuminata PCC 6304 TaxID=56110 RepID=K9TQ17_9CYAN|nr:K(+)-transporting ATPase subunit C [Oscillatoria acuminata]AFY84498.1 K+-transporting ATPase, C subunit [Oscillatoria acuminata PCC 6304]
MTLIKDMLIGLRSTLILWVITAVIYPFFILFIGQVFVPNIANGSLIQNQGGEVVGSALIGQEFTEPGYFWSRPSVINYSQGEDAQPTGVSGASNLAPSNPELMTRITEEIADLTVAGVNPTGDLLYSSGSGLDPHITPEAAQVQVQRVATARGLSPSQIEDLISNHIESRFLGIFGEPGVNVLKLNLELDQL